MASQVIYLSGLLKWVKVAVPDELYGNYTVDLYLDEESMDKFKLSGLTLKLHETEDGEYIKLRRACEKIIKGNKVDVDRPELKIQDGVDEDGNAVFVPFEAKVGNGSMGICKVRVYEGKRGKGHELLAVAVTDLIPYEEMEGEGEYAF